MLLKFLVHHHFVVLLLLQDFKYQLEHVLVTSNIRTIVDVDGLRCNNIYDLFYTQSLKDGFLRG